MSAYTILFVHLLPGIIASKIAEGNGFHPAIGFVAGAVMSWPGMVMVAIATGMMRQGTRRQGPSTRSRRPSSTRRHASTAPKAAPPHDSRRKRALTRDELQAASPESRQERLRAERERLAALQREAKVLRHNATVERQQSAAAIAARDELLAAREAEIERLRTALDEAATARDPWYSDRIAPAEEALPESIPADMPRQSFAAPSEEPKQREAGAGSGGEG